MRYFSRSEINDAMSYATEGGQGLHVYGRLGGMKAPACFKKSKLWAHLYDQDLKRLRVTARRLGVRVIVVHHEGTEQQHIDLCGKPLDRAILETEQ